MLLTRLDAHPERAEQTKISARIRDKILRSFIFVSSFRYIYAADAVVSLIESTPTRVGKSSWVTIFTRPVVYRLLKVMQMGQI